MFIIILGTLCQPFRHLRPVSPHSQGIRYLTTAQETNIGYRRTLELSANFESVSHFQNNRTCRQNPVSWITSLPTVYSILISHPTANITPLKQLFCTSTITSSVQWDHRKYRPTQPLCCFRYYGILITRLSS